MHTPNCSVVCAAALKTPKLLFAERRPAMRPSRITHHASRITHHPAHDLSTYLRARVEPVGAEPRNLLGPICRGPVRDGGLLAAVGRDGVVRQPLDAWQVCF